MKKYKSLLLGLIPIILVIILTIGLSEVFYQNMINGETNKCWDELSTARNEMTREISTRMKTNSKMLDLAADAIVMNANFEDTEAVLSYLAEVQSRMIFDRIDVVFPNGTILVQNGEYVADHGEKTYAELLAKGSHVSQRVPDFYTGKESIHVFSPVHDEGNNPIAILGATIYCSTLAEVFTSAHYGDSAQLFLIDSRDGNFVLDKWHTELGNIYTLGEWKQPNDYEAVDFVHEIMVNKTGQSAFISNVNGKVSYMSYAPVTDTNYVVALSVQDDVVFHSVTEMRKMLLRVGAIELVLLLVIVFWLYFVLRRSMINETRAKEAELALLQERDKELQRQYELAADRREFMEAMAVNLPGGYHRCSTDNGFVLSFVSNSFLEITGYTLEQLETETQNCYINLVAPEDRERFMSYEPVLAVTGKIDCTYRIRRRDGTLRWVQDATQYVERDGQEYYQCALLDIDDFVNELNRAKKEAEESSLAKTTFLFNASHDIRTPMNAILGFARIIEENVDDPVVVRETIGKIMQSGQTLMTLLNDVLELSRIERGKDELNIEVVSLPEHGQNLYEMFAADMEAKGIVFRNESNLTHTHVLCDPVKLSRIGMNFLSNAKKFTPKGGTVVFGVEELSADDTTATYRFYSRDTGIGMSKAFQKRAFAQFERERTATESGVTGSGLGLSITKKIIDLMGGSVSIDSEQGHGTEIAAILTFSLANEAEVEDSMHGVEAKDMTGKRVLLVEDNAFNREIAKYILEGMHFIVDEAENGSVCVEMLMREDVPRYDLILMDIQMPVMDGYAATEEIRRMQTAWIASVPIIAMTANAFEEDKKKCFAVGMNGHIGKPIDMDALVKELLRVLQ